MKNFLNYSVFFTTGLISQLVFALVGLASIWILSSIFTEGSIYFWSMSPPVFLGGFLFINYGASMIITSTSMMLYFMFMQPI